MRHVHLIILGCLLSYHSSAEVIIDGSLGQQDQITVLNGPLFEIPATLGEQRGENLFHSFQTFNLNSAETAFFSGPEQVHHVISRITGGTLSVIDGTIRSNLPQANFYLLNPTGIWLGPHAHLDISGAFYFSTADQLQLGETGSFSAHLTQADLLTVAAPQTFGFLTTTPAAIELEGSQLSVKSGQTLALIAGDLQLSQQSQLQAVEGQLHLISVSAPPQTVSIANPLTTALSQQGRLHITDSQLQVSGQQAGSIYLQGHDLTIQNTQILAQTQQQTGGKIDLSAHNFTFTEGSRISSSTQGIGQAGDINLTVQETAILTEGGPPNDNGLVLAGIFSNTLSQHSQAGQAGTIHIQAKNLTLSDGMQIVNSSFGPGMGGTLDIQIDETLHITGIAQDGRSSGIFANAESDLENAGQAGTIVITTGRLQLDNGAQIGSSTFGPARGGEIQINARDSVTVSGIGTGLLSSSETADQGAAGHLFIRSQNLTLQDGAQLNSTTLGDGEGGTIQLEVMGVLAVLNTAAINTLSGYGQGNAGEIVIRAQQLQLTDSTINTATFGSGRGGRVHIQVADKFAIQGHFIADAGEGEDYYPGGITADTYYGTGDAGTIDIMAKHLSLRAGSTIGSTTAFGSGQGGRISIQASESVTVADTVSVQINGEPHQKHSTISSASLEGSTGNAGQILIRAPILRLTEGSEISTSAIDAEAGNIELTLGQFTLNQQATVTSESTGMGNAGNIQIALTDRLQVENAKISTEAKEAAGGNIHIQVPSLFYLLQGEVTTSVKGGEGGGGNVTVSNPVFVVLNDSRLIAQAYEGQGGQIRISSNNYLKSEGSLVDASSKLGIDGEVIIESPDETVSGSLIILPGNLMDIDELLKKSCEATRQANLEDNSSFIYIPLAGVPRSPFDWKSGQLLDSLVHIQQPHNASTSN